jgi:hypothetical protein
MTFANKMDALIREISDQCYSTIEFKWKRRSDSVLMMSYRPHSDEPVYIYSAALYASDQKSNHQKLLEIKLQEYLKDAAHKMRALIAEDIPALDHENLRFEIELRDRSKNDVPRLKFELCGHRFAGNPVTLPTVVKRLKAFERHAKDLPRSKAKTFLINDQRIYAQDGYDAVRLYVALSMPFTLDENPDTYPDIKVMEVLDHRPYCQALFSPRDKG